MILKMQNSNRSGSTMVGQTCLSLRKWDEEASQGPKYEEIRGTFLK